ncbi:hypothetical protein COLU111180_17050 [Cohnella lubricantis]|uniref:Uncharacterized protein n=1 Tax=Cohnella lubricantis TaxID=2163172 RepID=A0A841TCQ5_9BACL|nr:hypothetical protein [Cohnella lubricantis]MBB6677956.1 hypothetical protein [Cohnella lubricantis]MBP2119976.1 hypothetical protein [Cohnella lubricantis]
MRNILITVMMLIVVAVMFTNIITKDSTGTKARIETQGTAANTKLGELAP